MPSGPSHRSECPPRCRAPGMRHHRAALPNRRIRKPDPQGGRSGRGIPRSPGFGRSRQRARGAASRRPRPGPWAARPTPPLAAFPCPRRGLRLAASADHRFRVASGHNGQVARLVLNRGGGHPTAVVRVPAANASSKDSSPGSISWIRKLSRFASGVFSPSPVM